MPVPLTWAEIKALTQVGDSPTNLERADVWDTIAYYLQQASDAAAAAMAASTAAQAAVAAQWKFYVVAKWNLATHTWTILAQSNVASVVDVSDKSVTINFTAPLADADFAILTSPEFTNLQLGTDIGKLTFTKNTNYLTIARPGGAADYPSGVYMVFGK